MTAPATAAAAPTLATTGRELHVERLVGTRVRDPDGKKLGRIEEIIAEMRGTDWVVIEVHLGAGALLERLVDISALVPVLGKLAQGGRKRYRIPWNQLDVSDPDHPRALVRHGEVAHVR
jgi:sporulation protein YlmC with PRC-barrel domain